MFKQWAEKLPRKNSAGVYQIEGSLTVADKAGVKDLISHLTSLLRELGGCRKIFPTPLARYWVALWCSNPLHTTYYHSAGYLLKLGNSVFSLRDHIRDLYSQGKSPTFVSSALTARLVWGRAGISYPTRRQ